MNIELPSDNILLFAIYNFDVSRQFLDLSSIAHGINKVEFFLADQKVTHPSIHQKMIYAINNLCRS